MRITYLLFLVPTTLLGGCAYMIAGAGTDPTEFNTKEEVHAKLGEPCVNGTTDGVFKEGQFIPRDAAFYEDYTTRRKIATPYPGDGYAIYFVGTLGTIDFLLVPQQLYLMTKRSVVGQTVRIIYDTSGKVVGAQLDGENLYFPIKH